MEVKDQEKKSPAVDRIHTGDDDDDDDVEEERAGPYPWSKAKTKQRRTKRHLSQSSSDALHQAPKPSNQREDDGNMKKPTSSSTMRQTPQLSDQREDDSNRKNQTSSASMRQTPKLSDGREDSCLSLLNLPIELLGIIMDYFSYSEVSKLRRVCVRFNEAGYALLNQSFQKLQSSMLLRFQNIKSQMPRRESARRKHPLARECDIIETLHMRLTLLQMTFGKHIDRGHCCFFAGEVLDEIIRIRDYVRITSNLGRAYKVTDELFDLSTMAMEYFKEHIEPRLPEINYFNTELSDLTAFPSPSKNSFLWQYGTPCKSSVVETEKVETHTPKIPLVPQSAPVRNRGIIHKLRQQIKACATNNLTVRKELRATKVKVSYQKKQLIECNSKIEQHERKFEEQERKFSELMREFQKCQAEVLCYRGVQSPILGVTSKIPTRGTPSLPRVMEQAGSSGISTPRLGLDDSATRCLSRTNIEKLSKSRTENASSTSSSAPIVRLSTDQALGTDFTGGEKRKAGELERSSILNVEDGSHTQSSERDYPQISELDGGAPAKKLKLRHDKD